MTAQVFRLPDLGEGLTEAEVVEWRVAVGERIEIDEVVATVETAKAAVEVPCPFEGVVSALHAQPGESLAVGAPLVSVEGVGGESAGQGADAVASAAAEQYREEEQAGSGNVLIGYGTSDTSSTRRRRVGRARPRGEQRPEPAGAVLTTAFGERVDQPEADRPSLATESSAQAPGAVGSQPSASAQASGAAPTQPSAPAQASGTAATEPSAPAQARGAADAQRSTPGQGSVPGAVATQPSESAPGAVATDAAGRAVRVISPLVRRLAAERGIDLRGVTPTGLGGIITRSDVESASQAGSSSSSAAGSAPVHTTQTGSAQAERAGEERIPLTGVRKLIAEKLSRSRREIPDATTWVDVDASALLDLKSQVQAAAPDAGIGLMALLARICVAGLARSPELNASVDIERQVIVRHGRVNLSFAAQSPRGLLVPVVHGADAMSLRELATALRELTAAARAGALSPAQLTGGTFTLNNYGPFGVDGSTPIINHPEAAMLGIGRIMQRPWVVDGQLAVRHVTQLSFTFDHRVADGGSAGGFLRFAADCVETPGTLLAEL